jgi:GcrA cell cycle regulator
MEGKLNDTSASQGRPAEVPQKGKTRSKKHPEEKIERVRELAAQGHSAGEIAKTLVVTRNVIMGICFRAGITLGGGRGGRPRKDKPKLTPKIKPKAKAKPKVKAKPKAPLLPSGPQAEFSGRRGKELVGYETHQGVPLLSLGNSSCRWPLGEMLDAPTRFCGREAEGIYCPVHLHVRKYGSSRGISCVAIDQ